MADSAGKAFGSTSLKYGALKGVKEQRLERIELHTVFSIHKSGPVLAVQGVIGWIPGLIRQKYDMIRLWNHLLNMSEDRVTKRGFSFEEITQFSMN